MKKLPKKGYTVITVNRRLYEQLKRVAEAENVTIPSLIRKMLEERIKEKEKLYKGLIRGARS